MNIIERSGSSRHLAIIRFVVAGLASIGLGLFVTAAAMATPEVGTDAAPEAGGLAAPGSGAISIAVDTSGFTPTLVSAPIGAIVEWKNSDSASTHSVVFSDGFSSPELAHHASFTRQFGLTQTITYTATHLPGYTGTLIIGGAVSEDNNRPDLGVSVSHEGTLVPGGIVDYLVEYENRGHRVIAVNTELTVSLPANSVYISSTTNGAIVTPSAPLSNTYVFSLGNVLTDTTGIVRVRVQLSAAAGRGDTFNARAAIHSVNSGVGNMDDQSDDNAGVEGPEITVGVRASRGVSLTAGSILTYALEYANHSNRVTARDVTVTVAYPAAFSLLRAGLDAESSQHAMTVANGGNPAVLLLGDLNPNDSGRILVTFLISNALEGGDRLTVTAAISSSTPLSAEFSEGENHFEDGAVVPQPGANLWVGLFSNGGTEVGTSRTYLVSFGNVGTIDAHNVRLSVNLPPSLGAPSYGATPTMISGTLATWLYPSLDAATNARPFTITANVAQAGPLTATASITATFDFSEVEPADNEAVEFVPVIPLGRPYILSPRRGTITNPTPTFRGIGRAGATVSVWLSNTAELTRSLIGTATVGIYGQWALTATTPITPNGWHWVIARQMTGTLVSGATGAGFVVSDSLSIDPNSISQGGQSMGGLNPDTFYSPLRTYGLRMRIVVCSAPTSPVLRMLRYTTGGLMTGYTNFTGTTPIDGWTTFTYTTPYSGVPFDLSVEYDCDTGNPPGTLVHHSDCYDGAHCSDDPPQPPQDCEDCVPGPAPRPAPIDPDGFVFDAPSVRAGATLTQSIITRAWVTATRQTAPGVFEPWNAYEYAQVNPQYTDSAYPDKVGAPGYYSFLVPPGVYRINVTAPGYQRYESNNLVVVATAVTLNVPMEPLLGTARVYLAQTAQIQQVRAFMPMMSR